MMSADTRTSIRKNPSREVCQQIIRRILDVELQQHGKNMHFKQSSDFMSYFESLYPASDSLAKQVQRAIKSMQMPKDEEGYFIPNKTSLQLNQEKELKHLCDKSHIQIKDLKNCEPLYLKLDTPYVDYIMHLLQECETFQEMYEAIIKAKDGLILFTSKKDELIKLLDSLR